MSDSQHSSPPRSKPIQVNSNAVTRGSGRPGYTFATQQLMRAPETSPMLMPVEQTQAGSEGHTSEYSSWGSSPAQGSTRSSPPIFRASLDDPSRDPIVADPSLSSPPRPLLSQRISYPYSGFTSLNDLLSSPEEEGHKDRPAFRGRRGRRSGRSRVDVLTRSRQASSALQDVVLAEEPSRQDEQAEAGAVTEDTVDGRSGVPSVMISSVGEEEEEEQQQQQEEEEEEEEEDEGGHRSVEL